MCREGATLSDLIECQQQGNPADRLARTRRFALRQATRVRLLRRCVRAEGHPGDARAQARVFGRIDELSLLSL